MSVKEQLLTDIFDIYRQEAGVTWPSDQLYGEPPMKEWSAVDGSVELKAVDFCIIEGRPRQVEQATIWLPHDEMDLVVARSSDTKAFENSFVKGYFLTPLE